jgi:hypothetical protein
MNPAANEPIPYFSIIRSGKAIHKQCVINVLTVWIFNFVIPTTAV